MPTLATLERYAQPAEIIAVVNRTRYSIACQETISDRWLWPEKTLAAWLEQFDGVVHPETGLQHQLVERDRDRDDAEIALKVLIDALHEATVTALGIARIRWRGQLERRLALAQLSALGRTTEETLAEAEMLELAWEEIEPAFQPTDELTLATFSAQRLAAVAAVRPVRRARVRRALTAGRLSVAVMELDDTAQAWYAEATSVFPDATTGAGEQIRGLPTTYVPRYAEAAKRRRAEKRAAAASVAGEGAS